MELHDIESWPCLLVIGAREHTLTKLNKLNSRYILIQAQNDPLTEGLDERVVFVNSYQDVSEIIQIANKLHRIHRFKAVVSFTELGLYPAAVLAEQLHLRGNTVYPVQATRDKITMRLLLNKHQLSPVDFQCCCSLEEVVSFYKKINNPFIIKPIDGAGSEGVYYVDSLEAISNAWEWGTQQGVHEVIAEEYVPGQEYSVESLTLDGTHELVAITEKLTTEYPHFIELGHCSPALLDELLQQKIQELIIRFLNLIQHQNGPAHTEIKIYQNQIKIIESQTRMGGDQIWELTELTTGVDVISETVTHLLGLDKKLRQKKADAAAILFFAREFEEILSVKGIEEAQNIPGIIRVDCRLGVGQRLGKLKSSKSRQGYVLGTGKDKKEACFLVNLARKKVQVRSITACGESL
jgi:biotin carboxylase